MLWDIIEIILSFQVHGCVMIKLTTLTFSKALEMNTMVQKPIIKTMLDIWAMSPLSGSVFPTSSYYSSCINWLLSVTWTKKIEFTSAKTSKLMAKSPKRKLWFCPIFFWLMIDNPLFHSSRTCGFTISGESHEVRCSNILQTSKLAIFQKNIPNPFTIHSFWCFLTYSLSTQ